MSKTDLILNKAALLIQELDSKYGLTDEEINSISEIVASALVIGGEENENNEKL